MALFLRLLHRVPGPAYLRRDGGFRGCCPPDSLQVSLDQHVAHGKTCLNGISDEHNTR